ncbi:hypothetical protein NQZ79_g7474 [Umbelopsis isabellina]|nr:hypothetical protein NQZ79_g7474 [Umbelopsis isabellina]
MSGYPRAQNRRTQNLSENKLKRINDYNARLKEQLDIPRVKVSQASEEYVLVRLHFLSLIVKITEILWYLLSGPVDKREDPFAPASSGGCCTVM